MSDHRSSYLKEFLAGANNTVIDKLVRSSNSCSSSSYVTGGVSPSFSSSLIRNSNTGACFITAIGVGTWVLSFERMIRVNIVIVEYVGRTRRMISSRVCTSHKSQAARSYRAQKLIVVQPRSRKRDTAQKACKS